MSTLQEHLERAKQDGNDLKQQLLEAKQSDGRKQKEVEKYAEQLSCVSCNMFAPIIRLQLDLANAEKKVSALEGQLDKILKDKNKAIEELTRKNAAVTEQLNAALAEIERLKLQQPDDELKEQLAKAFKELEELKKQYVGYQGRRKRKVVEGPLCHA